jgi:type I restriction enzyme S subunit
LAPQVPKSNLHTNLDLTNINLEYLQNLDFKIPDKKYQDKIVDVLYSIDKRIDIADRLYKKLNEFIRTTYDYYFVQFEFPSEAGKPYSQSGGSKTYSKLLKREIPSNWNVVPLNERLTFERGVEVGKDKYSSTKQDGYVKFYRVSDMNSTCENYVDARLLDNKLACPEDICVSFDGTVGKVDFGLTGGYSSGIRKISDNQNEMNNAVIYSIFISDYAQFVINKFATGSNILHSSESINNLFIPYDREVFLQLQKIITPAFDRMLKIRKEKEKLIRVRDWILPLLMNGQVTVD